MRFRGWRIAAAVSLVLAGCAGERTITGGPGGAYKVGQPYQIGGVWYYPKEDPFYDETGIASWYGEDFHGKSTANGERYDMGALTAAHRTLPMPTFVRVTNLENGRSLRLRVNDRGPYARGRIIDVSKHAADLLGFKGKGTARVRVQFEGRAGDPQRSGETTVAALKAAPVTDVAASELAPLPGGSAAPRRVAGEPVPAAGPAASGSPLAEEGDGQVTVVPVPASTQLWVQAGAFLSRANADRLVERLLYAGPARVSVKAGPERPLYRVRFGPFASVEEADSVLNKVIEKGNNGAQIVVD